MTKDCNADILTRRVKALIAAALAVHIQGLSAQEVMYIDQLPASARMSLNSTVDCFKTNLGVGIENFSNKPSSIVFLKDGNPINRSDLTKSQIAFQQKIDGLWKLYPIYFSCRSKSILDVRVVGLNFVPQKGASNEKTIDSVIQF